MNTYEVLKRPVLTEKTNYQGDKLHRYTFEIAAGANKVLVRQAVEKMFGVHVLAVNIMSVRGKQRRLGRFVGRTSNWRKAVVTVAPGESISFFEGL